MSEVVRMNPDVLVSRNVSKSWDKSLDTSEVFVGDRSDIPNRGTHLTLSCMG